MSFLSSYFVFSNFFQKFPIRIPSALVQKYQGSHEEKLTSLQDSLKEETGIIEALKAYNNGGGSTRESSAPATAQVDRTLASPDWQGEPPHNFRKRLELQPVPLADFKSNHTYLSSTLNVSTILLSNSDVLFVVNIPPSLIINIKGRIIRSRIFPTKDATKRGTTASSDEKRQGLSNAKNNLCNREDTQVFKSLNRFWLGATIFSTGNKTSLRSLGCHPLVLLLQGA